MLECDHRHDGVAEDLGGDRVVERQTGDLRGDQFALLGQGEFLELDTDFGVVDHLGATSDGDDQHHEDGEGDGEALVAFLGNDNGL